jgi:hypothetical protein
MLSGESNSLNIMLFLINIIPNNNINCNKTLKKKNIRLLNSEVFDQNLKEFKIIDRVGSPEESFERNL